MICASVEIKLSSETELPHEVEILEEFMLLK